MLFTGVTRGYRQNGTAWAYIGRGLGYRMAGKSGTAQVVEIAQGEEYDEELLDEYSRKHAWFMAFAPADDPVIAVGVFGGERRWRQLGCRARSPGR